MLDCDYTRKKIKYNQINFEFSNHFLNSSTKSTSRSSSNTCHHRKFLSPPVIRSPTQSNPIGRDNTSTEIARRKWSGKKEFLFLFIFKKEQLRKIIIVNQSINQTFLLENTAPHSLSSLLLLLLLNYFSSSGRSKIALLHLSLSLSLSLYVFACLRRKEGEICLYYER